MFYQWNESMSVGVPLIDDDHRAVIHLINRLHESVSADDAYDVLDNLLNRLIDYIDIHFIREERVMEACAYLETVSHKEEHGEFVNYVHGLRERFTVETAPEFTGDLADFLKGWLNHHILIQDMAYRTYAEGNSDVARIAEAFDPELLVKMRMQPIKRR